MAEIPKTYEPHAVEEKWYQFWLDQSCFVADPARVSDQRPAYAIVIPPPNVTGMLHMGHVLNNTIQDILSRKARMDGKEVLWLPGMDHAGIATQVQVEKALKKEERKTKYDLGREEFLQRVWAWKDKHGGIIIQQLKKLGCSCDWTRERFTMDPEYSRCVQKVFVELYKQGLIYRGKRMVNWCPVSQTALSDEEVEMKPQKGFMYHFRVEVAEPSEVRSPKSEVSQSGCTSAAAEEKKGGPEVDAEGRIWLTIATTRPETIPGDTAVAVNPKDPRYAHLIGKHIIRPLPIQLPLEKKLIPIIGDEHVDFAFGTGVLKVTPAHDKADFEIGQRHKLPILDIMNANGTMNDLAGDSLAGLDRFEARSIAVERLKELGALVEEKPYENNVGFSQRADVPIEPRLSEQWFLKYPSVEPSKACVAEGRLKFHPDRWAKVYEHWLTNIKDWCISRQLWWGHRIPVWYSEGWRKLSRVMVVVKLHGDELAGRNVNELRLGAFAFAKANGILSQDFLNLDTQQAITVHKASLEHAFSNFGVANVKLVPGLPDLLRHAVRVSVEPHRPKSDDVKAVETYMGALQLGDQFFRVKFRVKVFAPNFRLYDHQTVLLWKSKEGEPDGNKSPEANTPRSETSRPASGSRVTLADLLWDVNADPAFTRCQMETPHESWQQDPDVLDTWFSSWLWPFATMGWPEQTDTLKKFYPTADLVTGPDIIFFWVARMIMAGYEFMGDAKFALPDAMPFKNVYFTGIIRDKQGRKMSKTLGNSPDPLDLIARYGADALRFGTMRSAPLGQDVLFDEKDVELGRNFCNKLWNACRFRQLVGQASRLSSNLLTPHEGGVATQPNTPAENTRDASPLPASVAGDTAIQAAHGHSTQATEDLRTGGTPVLRYEVQGEIDPRYLSTDDKWILLKLDQAIQEITEAFASYNFSLATQAIYRFFWNEYCDWYVEASKAILSAERGTGHAEQEARKANTLAVIDFVLSHLLRLFHPFLPFVTEELWHGMGYSQDMPEDQGGRTIMNAPWPRPFEPELRDNWGLDDCYLALAESRYDLVRQGRDLRRQANLPANKRLRFILKPSEDVLPHDVEVMRLLLNADALEVSPDYTAGRGTLTTPTPLGQLFLPLEGLVDVDAEKARLGKELAKIEAEIQKVQSKLANPNFAQKVPPNVLAEHQQRLEDWQAKAQQVQAALAALG